MKPIKVEEEFAQARRFMVEWDLITPEAAGRAGATYDRLVANVV
jgi:hypothetical protein